MQGTAVEQPGGYPSAPAFANPAAQFNSAPPGANANFEIPRGVVVGADASLPRANTDPAIGSSLPTGNCRLFKKVKIEDLQLLGPHDLGLPTIALRVFLANVYTARASSRKRNSVLLEQLGSANELTSADGRRNFGVQSACVGTRMITLVIQFPTLARFAVKALQRYPPKPTLY
eukprot:368924-Rhodomonas_salina.1